MKKEKNTNENVILNKNLAKEATKSIDAFSKDLKKINKKFDSKIKSFEADRSK
ncbi:MAG: hypothetical protein RR922_00930 [Clostridia bacterium]